MKTNLSLIGLLQALGIVVYCGLIAGLLLLLGKTDVTPAGFLGATLMLILLVFSAAITGSIVFSYPAYLALNKKIKEALSLLAYTLLYLLGFITIILIVIATLI